MALKDKFTWNDFLKQNPEFKEKKVKRTSPEGEKAFNVAFKNFAKEHLKAREAYRAKEAERAASRKAILIKDLKGLDGKKWYLRSKTLNRKIGRFDAYLAKLAREQKTLKEGSKKV